MFDILIKNAKIDGQVVDIGIKDGIVKSIKQNIDEPAKETLQAKDKIVMGSFCNMHTHAAMSLLKGIGQDLTLMDWLQKVIWPLESTFVSKEFVKDGTLLATAKMIRGGTTFFLDMYFFEEEVAEVVEEVGIRAGIGFGILDFPTKVASTPKEYLERARKFLDFFKSNDSVVPVLCPHSVYTCSKDTLVRVLELAKEFDAYVHMHISETRKEVEGVLEKYSKRPLEYLDDIGILSDKFIGAHAVHLNEDEVSIASQRKITVVHCPDSNLKLGSGIAPIWEYVKSGVRVALGTDGEASNDNLSMLEEMSIMAKLQKGYLEDSTAMPMSIAIDIATKNGFEAFNIKAGIIKEGYDADIVIINPLEDIANIPIYNERALLLYSLNESSVETTIARGKVLYHKGEFKTVDIEKLKFNVNRWKEKIESALI
ncbi:MAG: amidohydrolase [Hydrogenobaculum sp.]|nr:MAG: S-adenosylhomocysteine deaminase [Hydrogenobaculum sp.]PMP93331.1 MAG: S-adenosylhomocysteine deaminase [Hydrogenobaculum sp.]HEK25032.1 amidohydrolase [Hydrogenobaculum sp.]